ncbi:MAG TPA: hypothetical protein EYP85_12705 [Armatimonadetes bacterium]|nr:hypothetical protein [Armatimonadota bacterium]
MKFIADVMLGRLARWLRLLGYDTLYSNRYSDEDIVNIAAIENRIILTRDTRLVQRRRAHRYLLITSDHYEEQLAQVVRELNLDVQSYVYTRCAACNGELTLVPKESVRDEVPPYVYATQERFARCRECGRIYWRGTHAERMWQKLREMLRA